ncbi:hypothetical protein Hdeb2414_s0488g00904341 [Helianthus debilis subsp. tardiflorus]
MIPGRFQVFLDEACNAKFEDELHYDQNVSGCLTFGRINDLSGISAKDLFLWFLVKEIWVDIPSSGLIYFDVGVVSKQFSLSSFETPRACVASNVPKVCKGLKTLLCLTFGSCEIWWYFDFLFMGYWILSRKVGNDEHEPDHQEPTRAIL